ncbi:MAG: type II toxin-antitoxin system RelE/ParE family toxin [Nitrospinae bacterium]|nr:type II toxin-antitoxin system RelE/ParE family toxin [Nitrospinota bacterium]
MGIRKTPEENQVGYQAKEAPVGEDRRNFHRSFHYKSLRNILKNKRRIRIGSYVLIFEICQKENVVVFHTFIHHDRAYK